MRNIRDESPRHGRTPCASSLVLAPCDARAERVYRRRPRGHRVCTASPSSVDSRPMRRILVLVALARSSLVAAAAAARTTRRPRRTPSSARSGRDGRPRRRGGAEGDAGGGQAEVFTSADCGELPHAGRRRHDRHRRPEPRRRRSPTPRPVADAGHERRRRDAGVQGPAHRARDRRRRRVRRRERRSVAARAPGGLPAAGPGARVRPRPDADRRGPRPAPAHAGRARRARATAGIARDRRDRAGCSAPCARTLEEAGLTEPVVCYQGAVVADPRRASSSATSRSRSTLAREAIAAVEAEGYGLNCYVGRRALRRRARRPRRGSYADFQHIPIHAVGPLLDWLDRAADEARDDRRPGRARRARGPAARSASATGSSSPSRCRTSSSSPSAA